MVRIVRDEFVNANLYYIKFYGLTADTKPVEDYICTGSKYFDIETGKTYYYDEEADSGSEWIDPTAT